MNRRGYRKNFWLAILASALIHLVLFLTLWVPGTWFQGGVRDEKEPFSMFLPGEWVSAPPARRDAIRVVTIESIPAEPGPVELRDPRPLTALPDLVRPDFEARSRLRWDDVMDLSHLRLLPPSEFEQFWWLVPDSLRWHYTMDDVLERALRDALLERKRREELLLDTPVGAFGVTPGTLHLGPIKLPIPLSGYSTMASRTARRQFEEIRAQENAVTVDDDDLKAQRERILEWKERHGK